MKNSYLVNCFRLKQCVLWKGSVLEQQFNYGGVTINTLNERITQLKRCDDLTAKEIEWLEAMESAINNWPNP